MTVSEMNKLKRKTFSTVPLQNDAAAADFGWFPGAIKKREVEVSDKSR